MIRTLLLVLISFPYFAAAAEADLRDYLMFLENSYRSSRTIMDLMRTVPVRNERKKSFLESLNQEALEKIPMPSVKRKGTKFEFETTPKLTLEFREFASKGILIVNDKRINVAKSKDPMKDYRRAMGIKTSQWLAIFPEAAAAGITITDPDGNTYDLINEFNEKYWKPTKEIVSSVVPPSASDAASNIYRHVVDSNNNCMNGSGDLLCSFWGNPPATISERLGPKSTLAYQGLSVFKCENQKLMQYAPTRAKDGGPVPSFEFTYGPRWGEVHIKASNFSYRPKTEGVTTCEFLMIEKTSIVTPKGDDAKCKPPRADWKIMDLDYDSAVGPAFRSCRNDREPQVTKFMNDFRNTGGAADPNTAVK